jgi:hypothetical protein
LCFEDSSACPRLRCARRSQVVQSCAPVVAHMVSCFHPDVVLHCAGLCSRRGLHSGFLLVWEAFSTHGSRKVAASGLCNFVHEMSRARPQSALRVSRAFDFVDRPELSAHRLLFRLHLRGERSVSGAWASAKRSGIKANRFFLCVTRHCGPVASP